MANTYLIEENIFTQVVEPKLKRIVKKCAKNGNPFTYNILGTVIKGVDKRGCITEKEKDISGYYDFVEVEVEAVALVGEYEVVAMLEYNSEGNIVKALNNNEVPDRFWHSDCTCDHCKTNRARSKMFVVKNIESGEYSQVGGSCLKEFTGRLNAALVADMYDSLIKLYDDSGCVGESFGGGSVYYKVEDVIADSLVIINKLGYFKSDSILSTKSLVNLITRGYDNSDKVHLLNKEMKRMEYDEQFEIKDFEGIEETVNAIIEYYESLSADTEFVHNIQTMLKAGYVKTNNTGYLAYLPQGYAKYLGKEKERAKRIADDSTSKYFGEVGKRYKGIEVKTCTMIASWETTYGVTHVYKFKLANGEILIWKTSKYIDETDFDKADFTVKAHNEYNGIQQTEITRTKLITAQS